jgi:hypothetical protein
MKALVLVILLPILLYGILRSETTGWRLLSPTEYTALETQITTLEARTKTLEEEVKQAKLTVAQKPQISDGSWMQEKAKKPSPFERATSSPTSPNKR